jgi:tetratricopeptide (TPR) repeat protein
LKLAPTLTLAALLELIEDGKNAELCRDSGALRRILSPVWSEIEKPPDFSNFDQRIKAELYRLAGVFLTLHGFSKCLKNFQVRGKDMITNAIDIYEKLSIHEKAAEAKINLAFCYWNLGEIKEADTILEVVEEEFGKNLLHPVYLQICVNRLLICFYKQETGKALEIISEIEPSMQFCTDARLQGMFHTQAGLFYRANKEYERAIFHLREAIRFAQKSKNDFYVAMNFNNLAFLYKEIQDFSQALECISKSIETVEKINHQGFLPHALDTQALIYLDLKKPKKALSAINSALEIFYKGEDYRGLTDALWTKYQILCALGKSIEAHVCYAELIVTAEEKIGRAAVEKFTARASGGFYRLSELPYRDEVRNFKRTLLSRALSDAKGVIGKAATKLGFKDHKVLSEILRKQFPELLAELGYRRRTRRAPSTQPAKKEEIPVPRTVTLEKIYNEREIQRVEIGGKRILIAEPCGELSFFYFDKYEMQAFGVPDGSVVAVAPAEIESLRPGMLVLVNYEHEIFTGYAEQDFGYKFVMSEKHGPVILDENTLIGVPVGFCPVDETESEYINFSRLRIK